MRTLLVVVLALIALFMGGCSIVFLVSMSGVATVAVPFLVAGLGVGWLAWTLHNTPAAAGKDNTLLLGTIVLALGACVLLFLLGLPVIATVAFPVVLAGFGWWLVRKRRQSQSSDTDSHKPENHGSDPGP